jgi:hypothetical protein
MADDSKLPVGTLESQCFGRRHGVGLAMAQPQVGFQREADMDRQARLVGSVEMTHPGNLPLSNDVLRKFI